MIILSFLSFVAPLVAGSQKHKTHNNKLKTSRKNNRGGRGGSDDVDGGKGFERLCRCRCGGGGRSGSEEARGRERGVEAALQRGVGVLSSFIFQGERELRKRERGFFFILFFSRDGVERERAKNKKGENKKQKR